MLNVGGGGLRQGPLVRGLTIAFNKCPPLVATREWNCGTQCEMWGVPLVCLFVSQPHIGQYCGAIHKAGL